MKKFKKKTLSNDAKKKVSDILVRVKNQYKNVDYTDAISVANAISDIKRAETDLQGIGFNADYKADIAKQPERNEELRNRLIKNMSFMNR